MTILVNTPFLSLLGGVSNHCAGLIPYFDGRVIINQIGRRSKYVKSGIYWLLWDIIKFIFKLLYYSPDIVWLNPSVGPTALKRDFVFLRIARLFNVKVAVFIHGFNMEYFKKCDKIWLSKNLNKASLILVLSSIFKSCLQQAGVNVPIELTTTKVEDSLINDFDIESRDGRSGGLLFLARVEKEKGIYETIDVFKILKKDYPDLTLKIVGDGSQIDNIKSKIDKEQISGIEVAGRLSGQDISEAYKSSLILMLLSYGEGMPTTVLEGMAFGLPVITRPVGGLVDFFENGKMGIMNETLDARIIADSIRPLLDDADLVKSISKYNHSYAKNRFLASKVANELEYIFEKVVDNQ